MNIWKAIKRIILAGADRDEVASVYPVLEKRFEEDGGPGSGNHGHSGRPGQRGGSASEEGGKKDYQSQLEKLKQQMLEEDPNAFADIEEEEAPKPVEPSYSEYGAIETARERQPDLEAPAWRHGSTNGVNVFRPRFGSREKEQEHFYKHVIEKGEFNFRTPDEYARAAIQLGVMPVGGDIVGGRNEVGNIVRYNTRTNELFIGNPKTGRIVTFMKPKHPNATNGRNYAMEQIFPIDQHPENAVK